MSKLLGKPTPTVNDLAKKYGVSVLEVKKQLMKGMKVEKEHTNDPKIAREIALDHLGEKLNYYILLAKIEEETITGDVRGLGFVSGDPAVGGVNSYVDTNAMSYNDENGNKLEWIRKDHLELHNKGLGYNFFDPTKIKSLSNFMNEQRLNELGGSGEPEAYNGLTDSRSARKDVQVDEGEKIKKAKKAVMAGLTAANIYTMGDVMSKASSGHGSPKGDVVRMASTLPGAAGWGATGVHYAKKAYDYVKSRQKLHEAVAKKKAPAKKPAVKEEGGSSFNEVMGRVYERATVMGVHNGTGAAKSKDKEYLAKIAELQKKQAADLKLLPPKIRDSALKAAESSSAAYLKSLKENHGVDPKQITEVHHTNKGIGGLIGRNVATRDNPHDLVVRIGAGKNSRLHGASLKKTQGTLGNNSHVQFSAHGKEVGIGHDVANIWNAGLAKAKLDKLSKAELKARRGDKKVVDAYKKTQQQAIKHHTESFNAASTEMQRKHLRHLMKLNHDPDVPYDYVNGERGYAKPVEQLDHAKAVMDSQRFAAVSRGTSTHIYDDQGRHVLTVEHRATHGPFSSMQANAKLGSLKPPKGETVTMPKAPSHPLAHKEASQEASQVAPEKVKKLLGDVRQKRTPQTKAREMQKVTSPGASPIASMPRPGIKKPPAPNYNKLISSVPKIVQGIAKAFNPQPVNEEIKMNEDPCWKGYEMVGMKKKGGKKVPNCVPVSEQGSSATRYTERPTYESAAWQRKAGKDPEGGLNRKGIASYRREHPGSKLSMAVTTEPSKLDPDSKSAKRRKSFCARMGGMKGPMKDEKGRPTRKALSLRKWNCEEENKYPDTAERGIYETSTGKKVKYAVKSFLQMTRIGKELGQDAAKDKTYQKREKGMERVMKEGHIGFGTWGKMGDGFQYSHKDTYGKKPKEKPESNEPGTGDTYKGSKQGGTNVNKVKPVKEEQIDELKNTTLASYIKKASDSRAKNQGDAEFYQKKGLNKRNYKKYGKALNNVTKRREGIRLAADKLAREETQINELAPETLGSYVKKASASRKKSLEGSKPDIKTWSKREHGIRTAIKQLTKENSKDKDWDAASGFAEQTRKFDPSHLHLNKPDTKYAPGAAGITHTIHEETKMDNKLINEAIENIMEDNLSAMKDNLMVALQEKAMEKLEERKKEIAANYFAQ